MEHIVEQAVQIIRERYTESLCLDDIACAVMVSKFHLLRVFSQVTGVTPGRFLGAVRIDEAKRLLRNSDLGVATIASTVGYSSTGSFTSRFTESVGIPPTQYRQVSRGEGGFAVPPPAAEEPGDLKRCQVRGVARAPAEPVSSIYIGSFDSPILQGNPSSWTTTERLGPFVLHEVPLGICYLHAIMRAAREQPGKALETMLLTATLGPLQLDGCAGFEAELFCARGTGRTRPSCSRPPVSSCSPRASLDRGSSDCQADSSSFQVTSSAFQGTDRHTSRRVSN